VDEELCLPSSATRKNMPDREIAIVCALERVSNGRAWVVLLWILEGTIKDTPRKYKLF